MIKLFLTFYDINHKNLCYEIIKSSFLFQIVIVRINIFIVNSLIFEMTSTTDKKLKKRKSKSISLKTENSIHEKKSDINETSLKFFTCFENFILPIVLTLLGLIVRVYKISVNNTVVWDEAHFGKFGSYYLQNRFYHDVHPPLGKMLIGLSGYFAGYNGTWSFQSGKVYPESINYTKMRLFHAISSTICIPYSYFTAKLIGFSTLGTSLFTLMVTLESSYITLSKFILLDSLLMMFIVLTFYSFNVFQTFNNKKSEFQRKWWKWNILTGFFIGCTSSVKMIGFFITTLVGVYTLTDLYMKFRDKSMTWVRYISHWISRIIGLVIIPVFIFLLTFRTHFNILFRSGPGDSNMSSLFQANLLGSKILSDSQDIIYGHSIITIKNQGLHGGLLHSHIQRYPYGSNQQQITTYTFKDNNNNWIFQKRRSLPHVDVFQNNTNYEHIYDKSVVRIIHQSTGRNLHSHLIPAPIKKTGYEVSGYGNLTHGDFKDDWIVEIVNQGSSSNKSKLYPLSTSFRLKHSILNCYLSTTGNFLPSWGFKQGEVVCMASKFKKDKRTWWNIEMHLNEKLKSNKTKIKLPKTNFFKDFIQLNIAMINTNNMLHIDQEKQDDLSSPFWHWPILYSGIRMCSWSSENVKYFMLSSPATTWLSTLGVVLFIIHIFYYIIRWRRKYIDFPKNDPDKWNFFLFGGFYPFLGYFLHYVPFMLMKRVIYFHHYLPALYFAMLVFCYELDLIFKSNKGKKWNERKFENFIFFLMHLIVIISFYYFRHFSFGIKGDISNWDHLNLLPTWRVSNNNYD